MWSSGYKFLWSGKAWVTGYKESKTGEKYVVVTEKEEKALVEEKELSCKLQESLGLERKKRLIQNKKKAMT